MNEGKRFEKDIANSIPSHIWFYRIKDSATSFSGGNASRFTSESRYDCLMWDKNTRQLYGLELKSTQGTSIEFPSALSVSDWEDCKKDLEWYMESNKGSTNKRVEVLIKQKKNRVKDKYKAIKAHSIKWHQISNLEQDQSFGLVCAFLMQFRKTGKTYCLPIDNFMRFWTTTPKKSINEKDIIEYGGFEVPAKKKKVSSIFDIQNMIDRLGVNCNHSNTCRIDNSIEIGDSQSPRPIRSLSDEACEKS